MQNFSVIYENVYQECRNIIEKFSVTASATELLALEDDLSQLQELMAFLKTGQKYTAAHEQDLPVQVVDIQSENTNLVDASDSGSKYIAEEEVIFNNEFNQIDESEIDHPEAENEPNEYGIDEEVLFTNELNEIEPIENPTEYEDLMVSNDFDEPQTEQQESDVEKEEVTGEPVSEAEIEDEEFEAVEELVEARHFDDDAPEGEVDLNEVTDQDAAQQYDENRGKIVEYEKAEPTLNDPQQSAENNLLRNEQNTAHKLKLANIKGLKKVESLFSDDPLEEVAPSEAASSGSLLKSNISTDYMEADRQKQEFRLDLNDKLAFSKMLFGGSQSELNETVNTLNSFSTLDEAKEFLSELYYRKNWKKVDEYAQRLWDLVENKFQ